MSDPDRMELGWDHITSDPTGRKRMETTLIQCKFQPVTSEFCDSSQPRTAGGQDTFGFPSGVKHVKPHGRVWKFFTNGVRNMAQEYVFS